MHSLINYRKSTETPVTAKGRNKKKKGVLANPAREQIGKFFLKQISTWKRSGCGKKYKPEYEW